MNNYFQNKTIWVTGASSGIGKCFAKELSKLGAEVILSSRRRNVLEQVRSEMENFETAHVIPIDMENEDSIDDALAAITSNHKVDIAILNAGISQRSQALDTSLETESRIMATNFHGLVRAAKPILKAMVARGEGHLIVMSSVTGKVGVPSRSTYAASKHALHGYFDSVRAEIEDKGVYITLICPGYIFTNISSNAVKADGTPQGNIDLKSKEGMPVEKFVHKALHGIRRKKREMIIGGKETLAIYIKRYLPGLFFNMVKKVKA